MYPGNGTKNEGSLAAYAEVNGTRLYYEISGSGPILVLIPGYTLDTHMWDDQVPTFATNYRVLRYDLRGSGKSEIPDREVYAYHEDLKALLEHLGIDRAHILGLSLGGAVAVDFALAYPQSVRSLILSDVSRLGGYEWTAILSESATLISTTCPSPSVCIRASRGLKRCDRGPRLIFRRPDLDAGTKIRPAAGSGGKCRTYSRGDCGKVGSPGSPF